MYTYIRIYFPCFTVKIFAIVSQTNRNGQNKKPTEKYAGSAAGTAAGARGQVGAWAALGIRICKWVSSLDVPVSDLFIINMNYTHILHKSFGTYKIKHEIMKKNCVESKQYSHIQIFRYLVILAEYPTRYIYLYDFQHICIYCRYS